MWKKYKGDSQYYESPFNFIYLVTIPYYYGNIPMVR